MSMHTVQHLLSAVLESRLSLPTLAWSLTTYPSPSYVDLPRALTAEETTLIQDECNRYVFEGRRVHIEVQELQPNQKGIPSSDDTPANREFGRGLPSDYVGGGGVHRVVVIDGVDRNPCCGTHLPTLSSLQLFLLPPPAAGSSAPVRHYFLSGPRLLNHLGTVQSLLTRTAGLLSCGVADTPDRVALAMEESKKREKRMDDVEKELADAIGRQLVDEMLEWEKTEDNATSGKEWTKLIGRTDDSPTSALSFLQAFTFAFLVHLPSGEQHKYTILLTSSPSSQTTSSTTVVMVFGSEDKRVKEVGEELKKQFKTLKGGGKGVRWSGKSTGVWLAEREGKAAASALIQSVSV